MVEKLWKIFAGVWLGKIIFFSFVIAPQIFKNLERAQAADLQNKLFPIYYAVGIFCGLALFALDFFRGRRKIIVLALAIAIGVVGLTVLSPMIREAFLSSNGNMRWLHPTAVTANIIQLLAVLFCI